MFRTIWGRVVAAFLIMSVLASMLAAIAIYAVGEEARHEAGAVPPSGPIHAGIEAAKATFGTLQAAFAQRLAAGDAADRAAADQAVAHARQALLAGLPRSTGDDAATEPDGTRVAVERALVAWERATRPLLAASPAASEQWAAVERSTFAVNQALDSVSSAKGQGSLLAPDAAAHPLKLPLLFGSVGGLLAATVAVAWIMARWIIKPVQAATSVADSIAKGQWAGDLPDFGADELGTLLGAMGTLRNNVRAVMEREVALRRSAQTRLADALESSQDGIIVVDADLRIALANAQASNFLGAPAGMLAPGTPIMHLTGASRSSRKLLLDLMGLEGGAETSLLPDGRWLRVSRSSTRDGGFIALCSDISVQKDQEAKLKATNLRLDAALENMSQGLCLYGDDLTLHVVNRRFCEIFRLRPDAIQAGMSLREVIDRLADAGNFPAQSAEDVFSGEHALFETRAPSVRFREIGGKRVVGIAMEALPDGGWLATYEDVTERRQAEERIEFMARHDALTSLPNRVLFAERVDLAISQTKRGCLSAVFCLDLDHFKHVNDTLGHPVGDELLRVVGQRLQSCVREFDTVARLGGDEFAVVQSGIEDPEQAVALANRIIERLSAPFSVQGYSLSVGVSIGISLAPGDGQDHGKLLKNADVALYKAKEDGRGTWRFFEAEMDSRLQARREMETDLRRALEEDQFEVYYQPQFDLRTDRICGFEALVRWKHPVRGMVSPGDFIPLAEEIGLIREIGGWVMRTACQEASGWSTPMRIAVNVSPVQLKQVDFCSVVAEALALADLKASRLELEITESVMLSNSAGALDILHQVRALGVQLSMDDFGTGYSSLTSLRSFPFDKIKIDQSFVKDLYANSDAEPVIRAVIVLGGGLGIRITAEGVETAEQLAQLRIEGCNEVQGYLISRPRPAADIPAMLERWNAGVRRGAALALA